MAAHPSQAKSRWKYYSTHYGPEKFPTSSSQTCSPEEQVSSKPNTECPTYGRQRSFFPLGIVSECDLKELRSSAERLNSQEKCRSFPCLTSSSPARWGTKFVYSPPRSPGSEESFDHVQSTLTKTPVRGKFRKRMYSCPSTPVNDFLRTEVPNLSAIMVQAQSVPLVRRRSQPSPTSRFKTTASSTGNPSRSLERTASLSSIERAVAKKPSLAEKSSDSRENTQELSKSLSEIKIEDGVIVINNGKAIDLKMDKARKHNRSNEGRRNSEAAKSKSYREFQEAIQKLEDAQLNLEGEVNAKAKTFDTREKEEKFFNENVQPHFLDLLTTVKGKRRKPKGKKYKC